MLTTSLCLTQFQKLFDKNLMANLSSENFEFETCGHGVLLKFIAKLITTFFLI